MQVDGACRRRPGLAWPAPHTSRKWHELARYYWMAFELTPLKLRVAKKRCKRPKPLAHQPSLQWSHATPRSSAVKPTGRPCYP